jgi:hypothetical protein
MNIPDHPEIVSAMRTGYPTWNQPDDIDEDNKEYCCECGEEIPYGEDSYECPTHRILCEDCLKMLYKRYV